MLPALHMLAREQPGPSLQLPSCHLAICLCCDCTDLQTEQASSQAALQEAQAAAAWEHRLRIEAQATVAALQADLAGVHGEAAEARAAAQGLQAALAELRKV